MHRSPHRQRGYGDTGPSFQGRNRSPRSYNEDSRRDCAMSPQPYNNRYAAEERYHPRAYDHERMPAHHPRAYDHERMPAQHPHHTNNETSICFSRQTAPEDRDCDVALQRIGIATQVARELAQQLKFSGPRPPSPPRGVHGVVQMTGNKVRVDPNARHCSLCDLQYNVQISLQHFEGRRHRQHLQRLVHLKEYDQLEEHAWLARQAGCTLTEEYYGPFAHALIHSPAARGDTGRSATSAMTSQLEIPDALRLQLASACDHRVGGQLMQELLCIVDALAQRTTPRHRDATSIQHQPAREEPPHHNLSSPFRHQAGGHQRQHESRSERSLFHAFGDRLQTKN
jgi:hypothetical protein